MSRRIILDTGPLVALLNSRDPHHGWVREQWEAIEPPLLSCDAVVVEACFLARRLTRGGQSRVLEIVRRGTLDLSFSLSGEIDAVVQLVAKYRDVPMSLADACLVRMSELHRASPVLTLDRDFTIYRRSRRQRIPLLSPGRLLMDDGPTPG
ncbi:MAG: PIN domain-containing protein [Gemmatimonadetes bacterium]|nr:PIN domain-containing protein [Candidatus Palauibacter rhopaloidicola]